ncbi:MAG: XdhC/CoxI family protein [Solirubrobacterales bacterium]
MTTVRRQAATGSDWIREGRRVVAALLVAVEGSAPLDPGASMLIAEDGAIEGSITGGCVEAAVVGEARAVFAGGAARMATYGISDELAGTVGLTCGGIVHILVHELAGAAAEVERAARDAIGEGRPVAIATMLEGGHAGAKLAIVDGEPIGSLAGPELLDHSVARDAAGMLSRGVTGIRHYGEDGAVLGADLAVHVHSFAPPPQMLIFGAIDFSTALARMAGELGYRVTVCDAREAFIRNPRFEEASQVLVAWPEEAFETLTLGPRDAVLVFSHDPKFDEPALRGALATEAGYIGALGSRRTTADRNRRLLDSGVPGQALERVHAPCGLDIGGSTPEEVAVSVLAEIIAVRSRRSGAPLRDGEAAIHPRPVLDPPAPA